ncbi:uncharacterized protein LY89DRAFT_688977 [Mollisia scopiformis]|uniref:Uncharacterized protein n=1 Tax=Mollisia scopiformis TaxID=149040 RepID=A0A194WTL0_MOLSC|nr:uncharacterized protein LY89DRAFT_688977 [Mollisia scopiformis]KUJ11014.1 hypothetical protein LY89DRAFT_688977 [Mollisia scopiformis]
MTREPSDDTEGLLQKDELFDSDQLSRPTWQQKSKSWRAHLRVNQIYFAVIVLLIVSNITTLSFLSSLYATRQTYTPSVNQPPGGVPPTFKHLVRTPTPTFVNVSWYPPEDSFFREHNSTDADEKWKWYDASYGGYIMIPKEEAVTADIDPARHAYVDRPDLGVEGYPVLPEAIHEMHCVNMVRRNLYYNIEHTRAGCHPPNCEPPELESWRMQHVDHCLEIIRNRVACTADLGIVPFMWYGPNGKLAGDMARMHTCSNYDAIRKFVTEKGVLPGETKGILKPPEGAFITDLRN